MRCDRSQVIYISNQDALTWPFTMSTVILLAWVLGSDPIHHRVYSIEIPLNYTVGILHDHIQQRIPAFKGIKALDLQLFKVCIKNDETLEKNLVELDYDCPGKELDSTWKVLRVWSELPENCVHVIVMVQLPNGKYEWLSLSPFMLIHCDIPSVLSPWPSSNPCPAATFVLPPGFSKSKIDFGGPLELQPTISIMSQETSHSFSRVSGRF